MKLKSMIVEVRPYFPPLCVLLFLSTPRAAPPPSTFQAQVHVA